MRSLRRSVSKTNIEKIKHNFFVFDVETTCLEPMQKNFVFGCFFGYNTRKVFYSVEEFQEEFAKPKYKKKFIFAHNAEFDLLTVFGNIFTKIDTAAIFNGKFISAKFNEVVFGDSMNIFPTSVAKLGSLLGIEKMENNKVKNGLLSKSNIEKKDVEYCMRDCEIVYKSLLKIFEITGVVKVTLPSLAMFDFRHNYLEEDLHFSELVDEFYESYYGGRTEAFFIGKCNAKVYDINSMYPTAMRNIVLPDVKSLKKVTLCDVSYLQFCLDHYEGMAKVDVYHPFSTYGFLPYRACINKSVKLVFPVGEFTTTVNFNELRFAMQQGNVKVKKVHYVIYGNAITGIFTDYIDDNFHKRLTAKNDLESTIYKLKMNSLYGRFAMRMKLTTTYYEMVPYNLIEALKEDSKYCEVKLFNSIRADCFLITENEKFKNSFFSIPAVSSYITSEARINLLRNILANENNGVVYCDTDSIFLSGNFTGEVGCDLGQFKLENKKITEIRGLKNYTYLDEYGKETTVIKGVSRGSRKTREDASGEATYESERYYKTKASIRQSKEAGSKYVMVKTIRNNYDKREILSTGETRPLIARDGNLINATTFVRTKVPSKHAHKKRFRYEPQNMREAIMMFFINGGRIATSDIKAHVVGSSKEELKKYFGLYEKDGIHMDVFNDYVPEEFYTEDIINVFQDVLLSYSNTTQMKEALEERRKEFEQIKNKKLEYEFDYDVPF